MSHWYVMAVILCVSLVVADIAFRLGRRTRAQLSGESKVHATAVEGALVGLLALMLGFTFAMAMTRYDARKAIILRESNAIGTAYLRTSWLPEPQRAELRALFHSYVAARVDFYRAGDDVSATAEAVRRGHTVQDAIWSRGVAAASDDPRQGLVHLFVQALNDMIDLEADRLAAMENHVPVSILALLVFASIVAAGSVGYGSGLGAQRALLSMVLLPLLVTVVIGLIVDLDRPREGLIQAGQASMLRVQQSIAEPPR